MRVPQQNAKAVAPESRVRTGWLSVAFILLVFAVGFGANTQTGYFGGGSERFQSAVLAAFMAVNSLRVLAYVPQMLAAARDAHGASGISYATWILFLVSHLTTILYALVCLGDGVMAWVFFGNALACAAIIAITFFKRRRYAVLARNPTSR